MAATEPQGDNVRNWGFLLPLELALKHLLSTTRRVNSSKESLASIHPLLFCWKKGLFPGLRGRCP